MFTILMIDDLVAVPGRAHMSFPPFLFFRFYLAVIHDVL
jgi:hypothetical protein